MCVHCDGMHQNCKLENPRIIRGVYPYTYTGESPYYPPIFSVYTVVVHTISGGEIHEWCFAIICGKSS